MKLQIIFIIVGLTIYIQGTAQLSRGGKPYSFDHPAVLRTQIPTYVMPELDLIQIEAEDILDEDAGIPPRFGYPFDVNFNLHNSGYWETLDNGDRIWRLSVSCPGAKSINLLYDTFKVPKGANLYIYNETKNHVIGGFTAQNNNLSQRHNKSYATGLVFGDKITLEYFEPKESIGKGELSISKVVHGYRFIQLSQNNESRDFGESINCGININCPEGNEWQFEKKGVAMIIIRGTRLCTGSLVNTTTEEFLPYLLTSNTCLNYENLFNDVYTDDYLGQWTFLWNYESPNCETPNLEEEINFVSTTGAWVLAKNRVSDFALLRLLEDPINLHIPLAYLGWDTNENVGIGGAGIYHPQGDVKKIAIHNMRPLHQDNSLSERNTAWRVIWGRRNNGYKLSEYGSYGSPLFNKNKRIIGQFSYSYTEKLNQKIDCSDLRPDESVYGKFSISWNGNGSSKITEKLQSWLAPQCHSNLNITREIGYAEPILQASNTITASNQIYWVAHTGYIAGNSITLKPGFWAYQGATFFSKIKDCSASRSTSRSDNLYVDSYEVSEKRNLAVLQEEINKESKEKLKEERFEASLSIIPNPFSSTTIINYQLKDRSKVSLNIYSLDTKLIQAIVKDKEQDIGKYSINFNTYSLASGIYYCILKYNDQQIVKKMILAK